MDTPEFERLLAETRANQNTDSFESLLSDGPIKRIVSDKVNTGHRLLDAPTAKLRQIAATQERKEEVDVAISSSYVPMLDPNEVLDWRSAGAQPNLIRKLKRGEYLEADFIDLHGRTIEQAFRVTRNFVVRSHEEGFRCILIIHGKGDRGEKKALIKSYVAHWLKQMPEVIAYHSAPEWKGGTGAVYIILKKNDRASALNRELHARR